MNQADLLLVLHAHLPFVRHPEHEVFLEENWLYEAITECYLPLLVMLNKLKEKELPARLTINVSPTLAEMLADPLLCNRYSKRLDGLLQVTEREVNRTRGDSDKHKVALFYQQHFGDLHDFYHNKLDQSLINGFTKAFEAGVAEPIACAATHAVLPLLRTDIARRAQIRQGIDTIKRIFSYTPRGIWLPECAYSNQLDPILAGEGLEYFFMESHGLLAAAPPPQAGTARPMKTPAGLYAFGRDPNCSKQVWSAQHGYPGDPNYREYYRDIGFDLPLEEIAPLAHPDGIRHAIGIKYHRVTGGVGLSDKKIYDPEMALKRAEEHARHFLDTRVTDPNARGYRPVFVAPYDAELFGHWWFEGPLFLSKLVQAACASGRVSLVTASDIIDRAIEQDEHIDAGIPCTSTWGYNGHLETWISGANDWIYRHLHKAEQSVIRLCTQAVNGNEWQKRVCRQAERELMLAQSSDWAFILSTNTSAEYARNRITSHLEAVAHLCQFLEPNPVAEQELQRLELQDNLFPTISEDLYVDKTAFC